MSLAEHIANVREPAALVADEISRILANALSMGLPVADVLGGVSFAHISAMKAFNAEHLVPDMLRREADRLDRMHALDTAAAHRKPN